MPAQDEDTLTSLCNDQYKDISMNAIACNNDIVPVKLVGSK